MTADSRTCPSCGARVPAEADRCDLCGTPVEASSETPDESDVPDDEASADSDTSPSTEEGTASGAERSGPEPEERPTVFCNQCGWENPPGARYCSRCGEELQDLSETTPAGTRRVAADLPTGDSSEASASSTADPETGADPKAGAAPETGEAPETGPEPESDEQAAMGRQITLVVGSALALVLGLFFVTQWSAQYEWGSDSSSDAPTAQSETGGSGTSSSQTPGGQRSMSASGQGEGRTAPTELQTLLDRTADSLSSSIAGQIDSLRSQIERASGTEKRQLQAELANLFVGAGHPGRAAVVQRDLAEATGTVDARRRAADLLYRWMQKLQNQGQRKQVFQVARHAAQAYEAVAEQRPDDLDARTRMGEAYLLTNEPMRGIKAINAVLEEDSTFVPARFQKGLALLQINRLDQATQQFQKVKQYAEDGSPFYRQAEQALKVIKKRGNASSGGAGSAPGPDS